MFRKMSKFLAVNIILVMALAACGGSDDTSQTADSGSQAAHEEQGGQTDGSVDYSMEQTKETDDLDDDSVEPEEDEEEVLLPSVDAWEGEFTFDGKQYVIGCNASEFYDDGWTPKNPFSFFYYKHDTQMMDKGDGGNYFVEFTIKNSEIDEEPDKDHTRSAQLPVIAFEVNAASWFDIDTDDLPAFDFYGICNDSTIDDMISILGNQWYERYMNKDGEESFKYFITNPENKDQTVAVEIHFFENGRIKQFNLCNERTFNYF